MNTKALKAAVSFTGTPALAVGASLFTVALVGTTHYRPEAAQPGPEPTVTVTPTAPTAAPTRRSAAKPHAHNTPPPAVTAVPMSDRRAAMPHTGGGMGVAQARPPSAPSPSPAAAPCSGQVLTVRLLHAACVSVGGG